MFENLDLTMMSVPMEINDEEAQELLASLKSVVEPSYLRKALQTARGGCTQYVNSSC